MVTCEDALILKKSFKGAFIVNYDYVLQIEYIDDVNLAYSVLNAIFPSSRV